MPFSSLLSRSSLPLLCDLPKSWGKNWTCRFLIPTPRRSCLSLFSFPARYTLSPWATDCLLFPYYSSARDWLCCVKNPKGLPKLGVFCWDATWVPIPRACLGDPSSWIACSSTSVLGRRRWRWVSRSWNPWRRRLMLDITAFYKQGQSFWGISCCVGSPYGSRQWSPCIVLWEALNDSSCCILHPWLVAYLVLDLHSIHRFCLQDSVLQAREHSQQAMLKQLESWWGLRGRIPLIFCVFRPLIPL